MPERTSSPREPDRTPGMTDHRTWSTRLRKLAWLPIPLLLLAMVVFGVLDLRTAYEFPHLLLAVDFLTRTVASLVILYLAGRSFLDRGAPGLLLLGCGVALWGASGFVATSTLSIKDANLGVTISNLGILLSALCHLSGVILSLGSRRTIRAAGLWLGAGYTLALGAVGIITLLTFAHRLPIFFVEGQGGLPVRHLVLASALAMFALTAVLLWEGNRPSLSSFTRWYTLALLLIAAGIFGMLLQSSRNSLLNWTCRTAQYLSGIYMLIAALAVRRDWGLRMTTAPVTNKARYRYAVAVAAVITAAAVRQAFFQVLGTDAPFMTFYPAVILAGLYGGLRAGLLATLLSALVANYFWIGPLGFAIADWGDWLGITVFVASGTMISGITEAMRRAQARAIASEAEAKVAAERTAAAEALRKSEEEQRRQREFLECLIANAGSCIAVVQGRELRFTMVNPAYQAIAPGVQMVGRTYGEVFPEAAMAGAEARFHWVLETGEPWMVDAYRASVPGRQDARWQGQVVRLPVEAGEDPSALVVIWDITGHKQAEEALRRAEGEKSLILDNINEILAFHNTDNNLIWANKAYLNATGLSLPELKGHKCHACWGLDRLCDHCPVIAAIQTGEPQEGELTPENQSHWPAEQGSWLVRAAPVRDSAGIVIGAFEVAHDITERKRAEEALRQSHERLEWVLETTGVGSWLNELPLGGLNWDSRTRELFFIPPGVEPTIELFWERLHPEDHEPTRLAIEAALRDGTLYAIDHRAVDPVTGAIRWIHSAGQATYTADGTPIRFDGINYDITERKRAEQALAAANERLRTLMETLPVAVTITEDIECRVITTNPAGAKMFGVSPARNVSASAPEPERPAHRYFAHGRELKPDELPMQRAVSQNRVIESMEIEAWLPDGMCWTALVSAAPLLNHEGQIMGGIAVTQNITELKKAEESLREANEYLREADQRKDEFLAILAHELRNPLAPVRYAVQILRMAELPEEARQRQQGIIDRQVTHMGRLLDDLLDVSRVTRGKVELRLQPLCLTDVLVHAADTARPICETKRQQLHFAPPPADLRVEADIDRLAQVIGNLLVNASKFTGEGGQIWLEAALERKQAVIRVRDTGLGIAPELLPRIFDLFVQADDPRHRSQGGLGIGLTLVKRMVELHGGTVEARSDGECQGSEFIIRLPALPLKTPEEPASQTLAPEAAGQRGRHILVVDDIADSAASLAELLTLWGHEARSVHDGSAAIETVRVWRPEVVLMDIGMPGMDGYETARRLRAEYGHDGLTLVALTGFGQETDREAAHAAGFDAHLVKPVDIAALRDLLARITD